MHTQVTVIVLLTAVAPTIWIENQAVGAKEGQQITLECRSEAYPKSFSYWTTDKGDAIIQGKIY
jgi:hypothetical protein